MRKLLGGMLLAAGLARVEAGELQPIPLDHNPTYLSALGAEGEEGMVVESFEDEVNGRTRYAYEVLVCDRADHEDCRDDAWRVVERYGVLVDSRFQPTAYAVGFARAILDGRERSVLVEALYESDIGGLAEAPERIPATIRLSRLVRKPCKRTGLPGCAFFEAFREVHVEDASNLEKTIADLP